MKNNNLRFLLALGGQKVVVLQNQEHLHIYSSPLSCKNNVSVGRLADAVSE
ncbi:MAG: hypothetical protein IKL48_06095 [Elusimicrobiaceae bacterium]|nr:hypothetical protein [Elusimicrobiaceae bacterium]